MLSHPVRAALLTLGVALMAAALLLGVLVPHSDPSAPRTVDFHRVKPDGSPVDRPYIPKEK